MRDSLALRKQILNVQGHGVLQIGQGFLVGLALGIAALKFGTVRVVPVLVLLDDYRQVVPFHAQSLAANPESVNGQHTEKEFLPGYRPEGRRVFGDVTAGFTDLSCRVLPSS